VQTSGVTWSYCDFRDNLVVDRDSPVVAWRQAKGHRLGWENSHEALTWNVFRSLSPGVLGRIFALSDPQRRFWGRDVDGSPWPPFEAAKSVLEHHLRGPDVNFAAPALILDDPRAVIFVDVGLASALTGRPPRWFSTAASPSAKRRRRAILEAMLSEEPDVSAVFRRGLDETIRRGFYTAARRLLLARAVARRLAGAASPKRGQLVFIVSPVTMRRVLEDGERFRMLLGQDAADDMQVIPWTQLAEQIPETEDGVRTYLAMRTVNRAPAHLLDR